MSIMILPRNRLEAKPVVRWRGLALGMRNAMLRRLRKEPINCASQSRRIAGMASEFEDALAALDARLEQALKAAGGLVNGLKRVRRAARAGQVSEIVKGLEGLDQRISDAQSAGRDLAGAWTFDTPSYLADGRFLADLEAAAAEQNLAMFDRDGRIYCFPLILRIDANQSAVRVGRRIERRIRPSQLVGVLAEAQKRPQRFREEAFLDLIYRTYRRLVGREWNGTDPGRVVPLVDIHDTLTLLPGADYPREEFARDLLLMDRRPDLRSRGGDRFEFPRGTTTKGVRPLIVYDEQGTERIYYGVRFVPGG
jgi:hypothetical protein